MITNKLNTASLSALGFVLAGGLALAAPLQDCCKPGEVHVAAHDGTLSTVFNPSTPLLAAPVGPVATGRVSFVGPLPVVAAKGKAAFEGERPEVTPLTIDPEKAKGCVEGDAPVSDQDRSILISKDGGIANVVIMIDVDGKEAEPADKEVVLDQAKCRFEPHVVVVPEGTAVKFLNSDAVSHNVHTYPKKNDAMNKTIAAGGAEVQRYAKADQVEIKCDIHPWMNSWMVVTSSPFYAVTGADGSFSVDGLPAGTHKVEYWHEKLGKGKAEITVKADGTAEPFEIKLGAEKKKGGRRRR